MIATNIVCSHCKTNAKISCFFIIQFMKWVLHPNVTATGDAVHIMMAMENKKKDLFCRFRRHVDKPCVNVSSCGHKYCSNHFVLFWNKSVKQQPALTRCFGITISSSSQSVQNMTRAPRRTNICILQTKDYIVIFLNQFWIRRSKTVLFTICWKLFFWVSVFLKIYDRMIIVNTVPSYCFFPGVRAFNIGAIYSSFQVLLFC